MTKLGKSNAQNSNVESCQKTTQYPACYCFQVVAAHDFRVPGLQSSAGDRRLGSDFPSSTVSTTGPARTQLAEDGP